MRFLASHSKNATSFVFVYRLLKEVKTYTVWGQPSFGVTTRALPLSGYRAV
nr:MAG TPA: hypothetical protein [Caudoviricetes sp.]